MPQVVQPHPPQPSALPVGQVRVVLEPDSADQPTEELGGVFRAQGVAVLMGEHEPVVQVRRLPLPALLLPPQLDGAPAEHRAQVEAMRRCAELHTLRLARPMPRDEQGQPLIVRFH
ncbi:hypothetical protein [Streptomyces sp. fd1-xmd]|uniref:hypothetical protein n=1 Tax=Streptomyces sp. fd1-xmd TaxID=1812480 RepID=UPI00099035B2|nr:hypothetical protein [Streptomyces sp. fd1-xmd]AQT72380.1 hypothetical protein B1K54_12460 [Streptomyces sp. fd1-xmd]